MPPPKYINYGEFPFFSPSGGCVSSWRQGRQWGLGQPATTTPIETTILLNGPKSDPKGVV